MEYYDFDGNPTDMKTWGKLFEGDERIFGKDNINGHRISTVWLGLAHGHSYGKPLIFETMIFCDVTFGHEDNSPEGCDWNHWQRRYATKEEALIGHAIACNNMTGEKHDDE